MKVLFPLFLLLLLSGCQQTPTTSNSVGQQTAPQPAPKPTPEYYERQAARIRESRYKRKRLLNKGEETVFWQLIKLVSKYEYRVFPQVSLGEIFTHKNRDMYMAVNSKRTDFCVTDKDFQPVALVEYYGGGHQNETSEGRDQVKKEAALAAGLIYVVIEDGEEKLAFEKVSKALGCWPEREHAGEVTPPVA